MRWTLGGEGSGGEVKEGVDCGGPGGVGVLTKFDYIATMVLEFWKRERNYRVRQWNMFDFKGSVSTIFLQQLYTIYTNITAILHTSTLL